VSLEVVTFFGSNDVSLPLEPKLLTTSALLMKLLLLNDWDYHYSFSCYFDWTNYSI